MENIMSATGRWLSGGLTAAALVCMYAVGMISLSSTPASAHGWHCARIRGHYHPGACRRRGRGSWWWRGRRGRRGRW